ncbi:single-stranded-DNA-specific exonuclease RecJ [Candidatus Uhrbacteria bacterium]|nr:single-stranded-DNA-specific exonuclease RecJ [Candidatus Uhrbacteria bacterium]
MHQQWQVAQPIPEQERASFPEIDPVLLQLLWNRGVRTQEEIDVFVGPDWSRDTHAPDLFLHMGEAVARVFAALERGEVITVHGDYDADGVCGSAVLLSTLRDLCRAFSFDENSVTSYIPHREKEGYGISVGTIERLHAHDHTKLVITVDCGISNKPAIDRGRELGIDTIVCDHHTMPAELPTAILIHPLVPGETYPNKQLCGTGVAFKLANALIQEARRRGAAMAQGQEKWLLDLVAIATVTDVMPLTGENRVLEKFGLIVLNKTKRKGLVKLLEVAGSTLGELDTISIGFQIGPRLNAAGRMTHASAALELLLEEDDLRATTLALQLHETNLARQKASQQMYEEAKAQLGDVTGKKILVAVQDGWSAGLVGLVAGKLQNEYHRPVLVVGRDGEKFVGSGRSIDGFDVTAALRVAQEHLDKFGGHPQACGFSVTGEARFARAMAAVQAFASEQIDDALLCPILKIDTDIPLEGITWNLFESVQALRPFGTGNPAPLFVSRGVKVVAFSAVGKDQSHLQLRVQSAGGKIARAIGFRFGAWASRLTLGSRVDLVYEVDVNEWNGSRELQLKLVDLVCS